MTTSSDRTDSEDALLAEAEAAEAEAAAAEAAAEAARARARAAELSRLRKQQEQERQQAAGAGNAEATQDTEAAEDTEDTGAAGAPDDAETAAEPPDTEAAGDDSPPAGRRRRWYRRAAPIAATAAVIGLIIALCTVSGLMIWQHDKAVARQQQITAFTAAASQGVTNLMSLDFNNADADLQRVMDSTTGAFHDDFQNSAKDFMTVMKESKVVSTAEVKAAGIESMDDNSAVVLVAAKSEVANQASKQPTPRAWRLSVTVERVGDGIKMSKVEFTP
ncbi:hypothetical protein [Mycolicibacterium palauense]|uniref:hypothetical protein n=1 Tax=Mycolicibacterium palauense TaxID=2034511 RepID=UPI000BFECE2F|nr:hypothetical protein [Mycolicibacterium palauense]